VETICEVSDNTEELAGKIEWAKVTYVQKFLQSKKKLLLK